MADVSVPWSGDCVLGSTGGLAVVDGAALTQQRLLRRLLTNPGDYVWDPGYGAGLGAFVGRTMNKSAIQAVIAAQAALEATVSSVTSVTVTGDALGNVNATIVYVDNDGAAQTAMVSTAS